MFTTVQNESRSHGLMHSFFFFFLCTVFTYTPHSKILLLISDVDWGSNQVPNFNETLAGSRGGTKENMIYDSCKSVLESF